MLIEMQKEEKILEEFQGEIMVTLTRKFFGGFPVPINKTKSFMKSYADLHDIVYYELELKKELFKRNEIEITGNLILLNVMLKHFKYPVLNENALKTDLKSLEEIGNLLKIELARYYNHEWIF